MEYRSNKATIEKGMLKKLIILLIAVSIGLSIFGYFALPDQIAVQFSTMQDNPNGLVDKLFFLIFSIIMVVIPGLISLRKANGDKLFFLCVAFTILQAVIIFWNIKA